MCYDPLLKLALITEHDYIYSDTTTFSIANLSKQEQATTNTIGRVYFKKNLRSAAIDHQSEQNIIETINSEANS